MSKKVSVVLASFHSTARETLESLDRQTLPVSAFEVVIVDDGTDPRAQERMTQLAENRPNFSVHRVQGPQHLGARRNAGVSVASGDYLLFMDGRIQLGDQALELLCEFADAHNADVCLGKTSRRGTRPIGPRLFAVSHPRAAKDSPVLESLDAMKIYRRAFLAEKGLRFDDTSDLVVDPAFDLTVVSATDAISVFADYPAFSGAASLEGAEAIPYLESIANSDGSDELRRPVLHAWHRQNLEKLVRTCRTGSAETQEFASQSRDLVIQHIPAELDDGLAPTYRSLSEALRAGNLERILHLSKGIGMPTLKALQTRTSWDQGALEIEFDVHSNLADHDSADPTNRQELGLALARPGDGVEWQVPQRDLTVARSGSSHELHVSGRFNIHELAGGRALPNGTWVPYLVVNDANDTRRVRLPFPGQGRSAAFVTDRTVVCFKDGRNLSLDVGAARVPVVGSLRRQPASIVEDARGSLLRVAVPNLDLQPGVEMTGQLRVGGLPVKATISSDDGNPILRAWVSGLAGSYPLATKFSAAPFAPTGVALLVDGRGGMRLEPAKGGRNPRRKKSLTAQPPTQSNALARLRQAVQHVPGAQKLYRKVRGGMGTS